MLLKGHVFVCVCIRTVCAGLGAKRERESMVHAFLWRAVMVPHKVWCWHGRREGAGDRVTWRGRREASVSRGSSPPNLIKKKHGAPVSVYWGGTKSGARLAHSGRRPTITRHYEKDNYVDLCHKFSRGRPSEWMWCRRARFTRRPHRDDTKL